MNDTYEVSISRYFDAPPELVYRAFVEPDQLAQWFAPLAFHVPRDTVSVDPVPGGHWRLSMVSNFDADEVHPMDTSLVEVVPNQLIVGYETARGMPGVEDGTKLWLNVEFRAEGAGTRLELRQGPLPEQMKELARVGWTQSLFKLDALMATPAHLRGGATGPVPDHSSDPAASAATHSDPKEVS